MLFQLPTFRATLNSCPVDRTTLTAHPQGHFCGHCQRVVQDFSQSTDPVADLAAARAASPDGRVCGRFRAAQVQRPMLTRRLRWFVVALVLVVGQGLTAREAWAQVRKPVPHKAVAPSKKRTPIAKRRPLKTTDLPPMPEEVPPSDMDGMLISGVTESHPDTVLVPRPEDEAYTYVDQMPELPGGEGIPAIVAYIQQRVRQPRELKTDLEGRVFVTFIVGKDGLMREARIVKGMGQPLDAETLRVVQALPAFTPGRQGGKAVAVSFTLPVIFKRN
jgi:TonB family protein